MYVSTFDKILNEFYKTSILTENEDEYSQIFLNVEHLYDMHLKKIDLSKFKTEEFNRHLQKFLLTYNTIPSNLNETYINLYCLAGFENDAKPFKSVKNITATSFGDNIHDSNNKYHSYWLDEFRKIPSQKGVLELFLKLKPSKLSIAEVAIIKLFIRRFSTYINKLHIEERYLKNYSQEAINKVLTDVGYKTEEYLTQVTKDPKSYSDEIMKDAYESFIDDIYRASNEAIKQLLVSNRTSPTAPTIPGALKFSAKEAALKKYLKPGHTLIDPKYSTMATCKNGKLYIGPDFYFKEFKNTENGLEYFKTIVAHEAMHQILRAFDDTDILRLLSPEYKKYVKKYSNTYHQVGNIVKDMFLNSALEQWHFKIKDEWYNQFYFPRNGVKVLTFKVLADKKQELLKNKILAKFAAVADSQGNLKIGIVAKVGKKIEDYKFPQGVISYSDESECIAELFPLYVEDILNQSEKKNEDSQEDDNDNMKDPEDSQQQGGGGGGQGGDGQEDGDEQEDGEDGGGGDGDKVKGKGKGKSKGKGDDVEGGDEEGESENENKGKGKKKSEESDYWDEKRKEVDTLDEHEEEIEDEKTKGDLEEPEEESDINTRGGSGAGKGSGSGSKTKLDWESFVPKQYSTELYENLLDSFIKSIYTVKPKVQPSYMNKTKSAEAGVRKNYTNVRQVRSNPDINSILVAVDTSASISKSMILKFFNHIQNIIKMQDIKSGLITSGGKLLGTTKEEDLFSIIPVLWHDYVYYPKTTDRVDVIKLNSLNYNGPNGIQRVLDFVKNSGTNLSSVAKFLPAFLNTNKNLKVGGLLYFTDMELYEDPVVLPPNIPIKILSTQEPRKVYNFSGYTQGKFDPEGQNDIIWDNQTKWNDERFNLKENLFKINGILYKDL
jgi:hypothetical protein